ncbi:MAG: hypothetical protein KAT17_06490, partial [Candidatus Aminicenantes bacterium]|nr:hypothetical protein [Candidatus Aminicenantes bacterium]
LIKVKENDVNGLKNVLIKLYEDKHLYDSVLQSVKREKGRYTWERVLKPLVERLTTIERQLNDNVSPNLFPHRIKNRKMRRFLKKTFPFIKRFENKPVFIKLRRYFGH